MKTFLLHACAFLALVSSATAVIFGVDAFDYPDGPVAGKTGGVSWDRTNAQFFSPSGGPSNWDNVVNAPQVFLGRLVTNNSSAKREYKGSPEGDGAFNNGSHAKAVYYRTTVTTGTVLPDFFGMSSYDFGAERIFFGKGFGAANFGIAIAPGILGGGTFADSAIPVQPNTTYVLVARVDYDANTLRLYVNPDLTAAEPATASASQSWNNSEFSTAVRLASGNTGSPVTWDDITVATSWSDLAVVVRSVADVDHGALGDPAQSLRDCLKYAPKGSTILFAPSLAGQTISLANALGELAASSSAFIGDYIVDASALANGITIDDGANDSFRLLQVNSGARLEVRGVTFAKGGASAGSIDGGAIRSQGTLTLTRCTLTGNAAGTGSGGALYSTGSLLVHQSTFSGNSAASGGAVESLGDSRFVHATLAGNTATAFGGGMRNSQGTTSLLHCTVAENTAGTSGGGVASAGDGPATTFVRNSLIAGNAGGDVEFIGGAINSFTSQDGNLIGTGNAVAAFQQSLDLTGILDPLLLPLGRYGGRTPTMPPLAGSHALERASEITGLEADQRGFSRSVGGFNLGGAFYPDSGAVEAAFRFVTNTDDAGAGSLRQALADAASAPGWEAIAFDLSLDGGAISLTSTVPGNTDSALVITDADGVAIDATSLVSGLTITKLAGNYRLFLMQPDCRLTMHNLTLRNGGSLAFAGGGGAIENFQGTLVLTRCTLSDNSAEAGGAIYSMTNTDLTSSSTTLRQCTLAGNTATEGVGGGIYNNGGLTTLVHCTISANTAPPGDGSGVATYFAGGTKTVVQNSIIAGNTGADLETVGSNSFQSLGRNVIGTGDGTNAFNQPGDIPPSPIRCSRRSAATVAPRRRCHRVLVVRRSTAPSRSRALPPTSADARATATAMATASSRPIAARSRPAFSLSPPTRTPTPVRCGRHSPRRRCRLARTLFFSINRSTAARSRSAPKPNLARPFWCTTRPA